MLKRNKGVGVSNTVSYTVRNDIIKQFNLDKRTYSRGLNKNMRSLLKNNITKAEYLELQKGLISSHFTKSFMAGKTFSQSTELKLSDDERRFIAYQTGQEMKFMTKFADDMVSKSGRMNYQKRMNMYAGGVDPMFEFGNLAYLPEDIVIEWQLGRTDKHCIDCLSFASGSPYKKKDLPALPRSGNSSCLSNCRCSLYYKEPFKQKNNYTNYITQNYTSVRNNIPTESEVLSMIEQQDKYYYSRLSAVLTKNKSDVKSANLIKASLLGYVVARDLSIKVKLPISRNITEFKHFVNSDYFEKVENITELQKGMTVSIFKGGKQSYATVDNVFNDMLVIQTIENSKEIININQTHVFKEVEQ